VGWPGSGDCDRSTLETYGKREAEFSPNSQLYREIQAQKFTIQDLIRFHERRSDKGWPVSADGILSWLDHHQSILEASQQGTKVPIQYKEQLNTAFTTIADHRVECVHNESATHQVDLAQSYVFHVYEDTPIEVLNHMYHLNQQVGKNMISLPPCDWREKECASNHMMRDCPIYKALSGREQLDHVTMVSR
jgi:hypothetical protein